MGATKEERTVDLIAAFENPEIKAIISTLGGNDQVTYIKNLPVVPFASHPKPFFGYSDNTHFMNFLWLQGIPSFYGGAIFTQFAEEGRLHPFTRNYLERALFTTGEVEILASETYNDVGLDWDNVENLTKAKAYEPNDGWFFDGNANAAGITWGGCVESIDEILRHGVPLPSLKDFENIILLAETSEEIPEAEYVFRVFRALGERGILECVKGILVGRPKAWEFNKQKNTAEKAAYRKKQRETILSEVRKYNKTIPIGQNLDFGHTNPQIPMPYGMPIRIETEKKKIFVTF
jgi:muramoyltetrapeptide carboxypeptidase LdcA involved in peptidoglycan recycling